MPFVRTPDGTDLFYNDWGSGKPLLLIHGWPLDADMWEYQTPFLLESGFRVVAYDRRGFGRSSQPASGYDYDTLASDLSAIIETLDLRDLTLVGFSMGGGEVARYLAKFGPNRIGRAALISAVTPYLLQDSDNPDGVPAGMFLDMVDNLKHDRPAFLAGFGKSFFGAGLLNFSVSTEFLAWASQVAMLASPLATIECVRSFAKTDFRNDMGAFTVPTLVVHGDADVTVPIECSGRKAAAMIATATYKVYAGAPHGLFFTEKDKLNEDLRIFALGQ